LRPISFLDRRGKEFFFEIVIPKRKGKKKRIFFLRGEKKSVNQKLFRDHSPLTLEKRKNDPKKRRGRLHSFFPLIRKGRGRKRKGQLVQTFSIITLRQGNQRRRGGNNPSISVERKCSRSHQSPSGKRGDRYR